MTKCSACAAMSTQDALTLKTIEVISTVHNACAPVRHYTCRCQVCNTRWLAIEVFDEDGDRPSEWSWAVDQRGES